MCVFSQRVHFRARDEDGGYTIPSAVPENPCCMQTSRLRLIERDLLPIEVLYCGNRNFWPFWLLWPWPWPDDLHIRTWPVVCWDMLHVQIWTSHVKPFESYRLTDIHTDRYEPNYIPRCFAHGQLIFITRLNALLLLVEHRPLIFIQLSCAASSIFSSCTWTLPSTFLSRSLFQLFLDHCLPLQPCEPRWHHFSRHVIKTVLVSCS